MRKEILISILLLGGVIVWGESREVPVFDLDRVLATAVSQHPSLSLAQDEVGVSDARRRIATASLLPAVTLKADETTGLASDAGDTGPFLQRSYGAQATQTIFSGGKLVASRRQAGLGSETARLQLEKQRMDVRHAATEAYWRLVAAKKAKAAYEEAQVLLQEDLEKAVRHELGRSRSARIELLATRSQAREAEAALAELDEALVEARIALLDAMGQRFPLVFDVATETPTGVLEVSEDECLRLARAHRPEIRVAENLMESARLARTMAISPFYPKVDLSGFYGRSGSVFIETDPFQYRKDWNAGVVASWPLFGNNLRYSSYKEETSPKLGDSSRTQTDTQSISLGLGDALSVGLQNRESRKSFHEEEWRYDKARLDVDDDVRLAVSRAQVARRRADVAKSRLDESLQQFNDTRALLNDDRAHLGDMAAARFRVAQSRAALAQAQSVYLIAVSELNRAIGVPDRYVLSEGGKK